MIIAGSRTVKNYSFVKSLIENVVNFHKLNITEIVSGTADGVDKLGEDWAREIGIPIHTFPANWKLHGRAAGPIRNEEMGNYADAAIVIIENNSRGSANMISVMKKLEKPVYEVIL